MPGGKRQTGTKYAGKKQPPVPKQVNRPLTEQQSKGENKRKILIKKKADVRQAYGRTLAAAVGSRGTMPVQTSGTGINSLTVLTTAQNTISRKVRIQAKALYFAAMAIVLRAIKKGVTYPEVDVYQAYRYLADVFLQAMAGKTLDAIDMPPFIWDFLAAIGPKKVAFKTAEIQYSADIADSSDVTYKTNFPNYAAQGSTERWAVCLGHILPGKINEFQIIDTSDPPLNAEIGAWSLGACWTALGCKVVSLQNYVPTLKNDASAYSAIISQYGTSYEMPGAIRTAISSEVFIPSPILAKFSIEEPAADGLQQKRGFWDYRPGGGSAMYTLLRAAEFPTKWLRSRWHNKATPFFKFYDFYDLFERFTCWIGRLMEQSVSDNTTKDLTGTPYPLTAQQTALMLRQSVFRYFSNDMALDLNQGGPDSDVVVLIPWAPGAQTPMRQTANMKVPSFMAEGIRSIRRIVVPTKYGDVDTVPILAGHGDYYNAQFTWRNGEVETPIYLPAVGVPMDLVDCSVVQGSEVFYLACDGLELAQAVTLHNTWVQKFQSFSTQLCELSEESGSTILMPNYQTVMKQVVVRLTQTTTTTVDPQGKVINTTKQTVVKMPSRKRIVLGQGVNYKQVGEPTPVTDNEALFSGYAVLGTTCLMNPYSAVWKYQNLLWCPVRIANHGASAQEEDITWYRTNACEPTWQPATAQVQPLLIEGDVNFWTVHQRNLAAAEMDIKSAMGASEWENDFKLLAAQGDGGIFGRLAKAFGAAIGSSFVEDVGDTLDTVGL